MTEPEQLELKDALTKFFALLDKVEYSDSDIKFNPNYISSCRVLDVEVFSQLIPILRKYTNASS
jgi:hypothetical protein